jgi:hypothetical protein
MGSCHFHPMAVGVSGLQKDSHGFIFSKPFLFHGSQSSRDFSRLIHLHGAVIIFNIGLAHHHIGKSTGYQSYLEKAVLFYDSCLQLLAKINRLIGNAVLLKMAALSNTSQLRFELGEHIVARQGLNLLSASMIGADPDVIVNLSKEDNDGMIFNILFLRQGTTASAA